MGATFFLGGPVKVNYGKIPRSIFGLEKLQIVSECFEEVQPECCQSVEHGTLNPRVVDSSPTLGAK